MALDVRIISNGTTYYLVNSSGSPVAGGATTAAATTAYSVNAAEWTQTAAKRQTIYSGGPPFGVGSRPVYAGFDNVVETIEIGISGSSSANAIHLIQTLRRILNTALYSTPAVLYWNPDGATNPAYFEIYSADVQEVGDWQNPAAGFTQVLCRVTWTRSAFGSYLNAQDTILNGVSFQSCFSGATNCIAPYLTGNGDLIYDGQPLNVSITNTTASDLSNLLFGSIYTIKTQPGIISTTTSSTTGVVNTTADSPVNLNTEAVDFSSLKIRLFAETSAATTGSQMQLLVCAISLNDETSYPSFGSQVIYTSPWFTSSNAVQLIDCGTIPAVVSNRNVSLYVRLKVRSPTGTSVTVTLNGIHAVFYWEMCRVAGASVLPSSAAVGSNFISGFRYNPPGIGTISPVTLPLKQPQILTSTSGTYISFAPPIGTVPKYHSGASFFAMSGVSSPATGSVAYVTTSTYRVTAFHAPLYHTLRGNG